MLLPQMPALVDMQPRLSVGAFSSTATMAGDSDLARKEQEAEDTAARDRAQVVSSLSSHIRSRWEDAKRAKRKIEAQMLAALRQRVGEYPPQKLAEIRKMGGSEIFMRMTETKCSAASAWIRDVLSLDRPWGLDPTPIPELPPDMSASIAQQTQQNVLAQVEQQVANGLLATDQNAIQQAIEVATEQAQVEARRQVEKAARQRADKMSQVIEDYLDESGFKESLADALDWDLTTFGTAIIKCPVIRRRNRIKWEQDATGGWMPTTAEEVFPDVERVSPLDLYPADDALSPQDASYIIEKCPLSRHDLSSFKEIENYNSKEIDAALADYPKDGLREYTSSDSESAYLAERTDAGQYSEKLDALIYWGECQGSLLKEWGIKNVDALAEYAVEAWLVGKHVIRVEIKEPHELERPYHKAVYRARPGSFWGIGIPEILEDVQQQINATARALANNMAMASGPQAGIDIEQMPPGENGERMWPWKVWRFNTGKYGQTPVPPITFFQPDMHAQELMAIYERWARIADDVAGIPAYVYGNENVGGAGKTASGLSMLMGASTKTIKAIIANIDKGIIEPLIRAMFRYVMLYHPDNSIKGDCKVVAKGSTALLVREQAQIRRNEFLQSTNNPADLQIMGMGRRSELLRSTAESLSLDPDTIAPTREEFERQQTEQQQVQQQQMLAAQQPPFAALAPDGSPVAGQDFRLMTPEG